MVTCEFNEMLEMNMTIIQGIPLEIQGFAMNYSFLMKLKLINFQ